MMMEYLGAAQGIELRSPLRSSPVLEGVIASLRSEVPHLEDDRVMASDMDAAARLVEGLSEIRG